MKQSDAELIAEVEGNLSKFPDLVKSSVDRSTAIENDIAKKRDSGKLSQPAAQNFMRRVQNTIAKAITEQHYAGSQQLPLFLLVQSGVVDKYLDFLNSTNAEYPEQMIALLSNYTDWIAAPGPDSSKKLPALAPCTYPAREDGTYAPLTAEQLATYFDAAVPGAIDVLKRLSESPNATYWQMASAALNLTATVNKIKSDDPEMVQKIKDALTEILVIFKGSVQSEVVRQQELIIREDQRLKEDYRAKPDWTDAIPAERLGSSLADLSKFYLQRFPTELASLDGVFDIDSTNEQPTQKAAAEYPDLVATSGRLSLASYIISYSDAGELIQQTSTLLDMLYNGSVDTVSAGLMKDFLKHVLAIVKRRDPVQAKELIGKLFDRMDNLWESYTDGKISQEQFETQSTFFGNVSNISTIGIDIVAQANIPTEDKERFTNRLLDQQIRLALVGLNSRLRAENMFTLEDGNIKYTGENMDPYDALHMVTELKNEIFQPFLTLLNHGGEINDQARARLQSILKLAFASVDSSAKDYSDVFASSIQELTGFALKLKLDPAFITY